MNRSKSIGVDKKNILPIIKCFEQLKIKWHMIHRNNFILEEIIKEATFSLKDTSLPERFRVYF